MKELSHHSHPENKKQCANESPFRSVPPSKPGMNLLCQSAEIGDALQLVIGKLDPKMTFQFREQIQSLQAVDAERFEKIVVGMEFRARNFEVNRGEIQDFIEGFLGCRHLFLKYPPLRGLPK